MAFLQSTYPDVMPVGAAGMQANSEEWNAITRTASGAIGFGLPVIRVGDHNCILATQEVLEAAAAASAEAAPAGATITAAPTVSAGAALGTYKVRAITAGATAKWVIEDPNGVQVGVATTGTPFSGSGLAFTVTDTGTDPAVGETFDIVVTATEATDDLDVLGLSIRNIGLGHASSPDAYAQYDNVAIMTMGAMWVIAGATVTAGQDVYWNPATSKYTSTATHLRVPGAKFDSGGADTALVKVALR